MSPSDIELDESLPRAHALYAHLRQLITSGELPPGGRLVERSIAEQYGISRTPVREALHRLSVDGLVESTATGTHVRRVGMKELGELFVVRETLEGLSSRLAATTRSELDVSLLRETMEELEAATSLREVHEISRLGRRLHEQIGEAAGNEYLSKQLADLRGFINQVQGTAYSFEGLAEVGLREHVLIVEAIAAREAGRAEELTRTHFRTIADTRMRRVRQAGVS